MAKYLILVSLFISQLSSVAQEYVKTDGNLDVNGDPGSTMMQKKYIPKNEGSKLLFDDYYGGKIYVKGRSQGNDLNIDLEKKTVLFKVKNEIRELNFSGVDSVVFSKFKVIFTLGELRGCLLAYNVGVHTIIDHKTASLDESDYNKSLDVGNRDNKWIIKDEFYLVKLIDDYYDEDYGVVKIPSSKKKITQLFSNSDEVSTYIKKNNIKFKVVEDYVKLFSEYSEKLN
jgi:hypothetical protein